jgi:hypothetical protein
MQAPRPRHSTSSDIVAKDFLAPITAVHQVINGSFALDTHLPRRASVQTKSLNCVNSED